MCNLKLSQIIKIAQILESADKTADRKATRRKIPGRKQTPKVPRNHRLHGPANEIPPIGFHSRSGFAEG